MEYREILEELRNDYVHGASWYFMKMADLIEAGQREGINVDEMSRDIRSIRPGMAALENVAELLEIMDPLRLAKAIRAYWQRARKALYDNSTTMKGRFRSIVTLSYSSSVVTFTEATGASVVALKSDPGGEGNLWSRHGALVMPDLLMSYVVSNIDAVAIGCDGVYSEVFLNKVGTLPLVLLAKHLKKPVILIFESFKAHASKPPTIHRIRISDIEAPLFDEVPLGLVDIAVTDIGVFGSINPRELEDKFRREIMALA